MMPTLKSYRTGFVFVLAVVAAPQTICAAFGVAAFVTPSPTGAVAPKSLSTSYFAHHQNNGLMGESMAGCSKIGPSPLHASRLFQDPTSSTLFTVKRSTSTVTEWIRRYCCFLRSQLRLNNNIVRNIKPRKWFCRTLAVVALYVLLHFSVVPPTSAWAAGSSGRMGGSVGSSSRPSMSRPSMHYHHRPPSPQIQTYGRTRSPPIQILYHQHYHQRRLAAHNQRQRQETTTTVVAPDGTTTIARKETRHDGNSIAASDVVFLMGIASVVAYKVANAKSTTTNDPYSPLGPGASAVSLTLCLNVPDRRSIIREDGSIPSTNNILSALETMAETADTSTRSGLQNIVEETSVELLRQKDSIVSVRSQYQHMGSPTQAERQYRQWSTTQRGKFEKESFSNYGGTVKKSPGSTLADYNESPSHTLPSSTVALVHVTLAIEGDSLKKAFHDRITSRKELQSALTQLSSDVQVDNCLLSAEVIWSPQDPNDQLTMQDIYVDFPSLYTLLD